ncbi:helix-turn-helix transcriptional regulator [Dactylosporangium sp. AC04546]|uniref:helix-turn-helix domain-containing protein n=1 Tax=Dactylosporangium sp. AC04546 TaxID=2862460 RepID=UPI001EDE96D0|nr:helix-turn-helix transcriptional regulator [Dactylosporangium sp. AC04546]WVK84985.1 helix-turn-helix transcriptional regulator [Dactylosporangium sp. AC04546]
MDVRPVGVLLREWRERRRLSQLELSIQADISTRHLSFVETGRSRPTSAMILRLTEQLDVPLRERNALLLAGGYAPAYPEGRLDGPQLNEVRAALRQVLAGHEPYPAVVVDRRWNMLDANAPIARLIEGAAAHLLAPPVNVLRLSLHPEGLAPRIVNLAEWRAHLLSRLERQVAASGAEDLRELLDELRGYPGSSAAAVAPKGPQDVVVPFRIRVEGGELRFFSITAVFGSPLDVTVSELAIESFFPADEATSAALRRL